MPTIIKLLQKGWVYLGQWVGSVRVSCKLLYGKPQSGFPCWRCVLWESLMFHFPPRSIFLSRGLLRVSLRCLSGRNLCHSTQTYNTKSACLTAFLVRILVRDYHIAMGDGLSKPRPAPHCRVLLPGEFTGMLPDPLPIILKVSWRG